MASCGVWLRSPHLLLQFYAPLAVVWAGCTHATAGAPDVLPMLLFVGATERLQQFCVTRTPARMRHAASVVVFVRVDCCSATSSSSQCRVFRGAHKSRLVAAPLGGVRASRRRPGFSSAEPPSWSSPPQRCYGSTRGLIRGNLASGGLIRDVSCEWTPAGGFLRPRGLCGFDTPKRCQGLTRPEPLDGRRALA